MQWLSTAKRVLHWCELALYGLIVLSAAALILAVVGAVLFAIYKAATLLLELNRGL
jgi:hypothetical protein